MTPSVLNQILLGALLASVIAVLSLRLGLLTRRGSLTQFAVGWLLFGFGSWQWTVPIVVFFLASNLLSHMTDVAHRPGSDLFGKGDTRDGFQVAANGGVASLLVLPWFLTGAEVFYVAYLGAVGASAADTWATSIGLTSPHPPRSIRSLRATLPGQSGGVTPRGLAAAAIGGMAIALTGAPWLVREIAGMVAVAPVAFLASLVDSMLGATLQLQYRCGVCGRMTERSVHCGALSQWAAGRHWFTNDLVNLLSSCAGGGGAALVYLGMGGMGF
jgi:uncharacterized protein (TIGR00297 family)